MELLLATTNSGKIQEIRESLRELPLILRPLSDFPGHPEVAEEGETFEANALKKAREFAAWSGKRVLADDSGLVVPALGGRPGIQSARFAGPGATDEMNRQKLIGEIQEIPEADRGAYFICVIAVVEPSGREWTAEGRCEGRLLTASRGSWGFGYDPLFFIPAIGKTVAEIPLAEKNRLSHRGQALQKIKERLRSFS